jgi:hypothetical protein
VATRSTAPAFRTALLAALQAKPALAQVQTGYSHPGDTREDESIYLGEVRGSSEIPVIRAARKARQERYTLDVWFDVDAVGPDAETASERVWELYGELEDILADDPSVGLPAPFWAALGDFTETLMFDESRRGWGSLLRAGVDVEARLT